MRAPPQRWPFIDLAAAVAFVSTLSSPASATPPPTDEVIATVTAISPVPSPPTEIRTWRVTFHLDDLPPTADPIPRELTVPFRSPALNLLRVGRKYRLWISKRGDEYVVDRSRISVEYTARTPPDPHPIDSYYRVMRVLTRRPYLTWLAENSGTTNLFMSTIGDDPRKPRHAVVIDKAETGVLQRVPVTAAEVTFDKVDGLGAEFALVKLSSPSADSPFRLLEHMQYLVRRPGRRGRMGDIACQFVGNASIQVTRRDPLAFHVTATATRDEAAPSLDYQMIPPEIIPSSSTCTILAPRDDPSANDFEYESTLALADMLSGKNHLVRAGEARQRALHMRPNVENAEAIALLSITELDSFLDGGCSFEPTGPNPLPIPKHLVPLLRAYDDYVTRFPDGRHVPYFIERKAAYLAQCQHHREAAQLYGTLVDKYPSHPLSEDAVLRRAEELSLAPR